MDFYYQLNLSNYKRLEHSSQAHLSMRRTTGGYSHIVWVGVCRWVRESPTLH